MKLLRFPSSSFTAEPRVGFFISAPGLGRLAEIPK